MTLESLHRQAEEFRFDTLPRAFGGAAGMGRLRAVAEDFFVEEIPGFEPEGEGEHLFLYVEKRNLNTADVAERLGRLAGVRPVDVGFAGLKDRRAVTRQWFSLRLAGRRDPETSDLAGEGFKVLRALRGKRKLQRGMLVGNRFVIRVRDFAGDAERAETVLRRLAADGFPNYFGPQRFGRDNGNLHGAAEVFATGRPAPRAVRGFYLSAARSLLFNQVLAERVKAGNWNRVIDGDVLQLEGTDHLFVDFAPNPAASDARCARGELHPTAPLWGRDVRFNARRAALSLERDALASFVPWRQGLESQGVVADRRALRCLAGDLEWTKRGEGWELGFALRAGSFATSLMREWLDFAVE